MLLTIQICYEYLLNVMLVWQMKRSPDTDTIHFYIGEIIKIRTIED